MFFSSEKFCKNSFSVIYYLSSNGILISGFFYFLKFYFFILFFRIIFFSSENFWKKSLKILLKLFSSSFPLITDKSHSSLFITKKNLIKPLHHYLIIPIRQFPIDLENHKTAGMRPLLSGVVVSVVTTLCGRTNGHISGVHYNYLLKKKKTEQKYFSALTMATTWSGNTFFSCFWCAKRKYTAFRKLPQYGGVFDVCKSAGKQCKFCNSHVLFLLKK